MPISFKNQTVTVIRPTFATDNRNNEVAVWTGATETDVSGCRFQPEIGNEQMANSYGVGRESIQSRAVIFGPASMDVLPTDRVRFDGTVYEIEGPIRRWSSPSGALAHVEFTVERTEG